MNTWRMRNNRNRKQDRRGALTLEAVLVLAILLLVTLAVFQFGIVMLIEGTITHAATVAAREAAKGADIDATAESVNAVVGLHGLAVGPGVTLILEDPLAATPILTRGDAAVSPPALPSLPAGYLRTTLCVSLAQRPFLNALRCFTLDFSGRRFTVSAVARREFAGPPEVTVRPECNCH